MNKNTAIIICVLLTGSCYVVVGVATQASYSEIRWAYPPRSKLKLPAPAEYYFRYYSLAWCAPAAAFAFSAYILTRKTISTDLLAIFAAVIVSFLAIYCTGVVTAFYLTNQRFLQ